MELTDRQRAIVAFILASAGARRKWRLPWNDVRCDEMMDGGPPLKMTKEHWEPRVSRVLRLEARGRSLQHPTWLTVAEITERHGAIAPGTPPATAVVRDRPTHLYNVGKVEGLPDELMRRYWEIHPLHSDPRNPDFERFLSTLDVEIRHRVDKPEESERLAYLTDGRAILTPPFELYYTAVDYYLSLAHELVHWAEDVTAGVRPRRDDPEPVKARRELVAEFGAVFVCDELGLQADPGVLYASPIDYIDGWRKAGMLDDREALNAAQTAPPGPPGSAGSRPDGAPPPVDPIGTHRRASTVPAPPASRDPPPSRLRPRPAASLSLLKPWERWIPPQIPPPGSTVRHASSRAPDRLTSPFRQSKQQSRRPWLSRHPSTPPRWRRRPGSRTSRSAQCAFAPCGT